MQRPRFLFLPCAMLVLAAIGGCGTTPRLDRDFGRSVAALRTQQVFNPQAALNRDPVVGMDGKAANAAYESYQKSFTAPVPPTAAFTIGVGGRQ
ncbi:pilus assembly protein [Janthinobacterium sp.]|uniref:pilus assembly protein n=1 Tax=Janthinobacterium sp. TaxID=1871054 RepID=UPI00289B1F8D|nr:pilus assembly protein [Janthinobacterium sp.]